MIPAAEEVYWISSAAELDLPGSLDSLLAKLKTVCHKKVNGF